MAIFRFGIRANQSEIEDVRTQVLEELKITYGMKVKNLSKNEEKAKTLQLQWLEDGSTPPAPAYWTDWKTDRDALETSYQTKKTTVTDATTVAAINAVDW